MKKAIVISFTVLTLAGLSSIASAQSIWGDISIQQPSPFDPPEISTTTPTFTPPVTTSPFRWFVLPFQSIGGD